MLVQSTSTSPESEITWAPTSRKTIEWDAEPLKKSVKEGIDKCTKQSANCTGRIVKAGVSTCSPAVIDGVVKPTIKYCSGVEMSDTSNPMVVALTGKAVSDIVDPSIDDCVKATTVCSNKALKRSADTCIDKSKSLFERVANWFNY